MRPNVRGILLAIGAASLLACANDDGASPQPPGSSVDARVVLPGDGPPTAEGEDAVMIAGDPSLPGPYAAGVRTIELVDPARDRPFSVEIWYPADPADLDYQPNAYTLETPFATLATIETPARREAAPAPGGAWPLIIFSHGYGGVRTQSYFLTEHLATHSFVVAAPDHPGNTFADLLSGDDDAAQSAVDRPLDVIFTVDRLLAGGAGLPLDPARVGVAGHSFGGWTSLEVARRDPRFGVVLAMAPGFRNGSTPDFVAELNRPVAFFGGSEDGTCPFDSDQMRPYELASRPKLLLEILGGGHLDFSNLCEIPLAAAFVDDGCDPTKIEPADVHERVKTVAAAFAARWLSGQSGADVFLSTSYVLALDRVAYWYAP